MRALCIFVTGFWEKGRREQCSRGGFLVLHFHAALQMSTDRKKTKHGTVFVPVVSRRANLPPKDDLEAKRHLKPERVMLAEVRSSNWLVRASHSQSPELAS